MFVEVRDGPQHPLHEGDVSRFGKVHMFVRAVQGARVSGRSRVPVW
jgi:hypothetical protein